MREDVSTTADSGLGSLRQALINAQNGISPFAPAGLFAGRVRAWRP
jgi:hypothetical protein